MNSIPSWITQLSETVTEVNIPAWLMAMRKKHWETFLSQGLPSPKHERWKYTDLGFLTQQKFQTADNVLPDVGNLVNQYRLSQHDSILIVLINGRFVPALSESMPCGLTVAPLRTACQTHADVIRKHWELYFQALPYSAFVSLNAAVFLDGLFLHLAQGCKLEKPIQLLSFNIFQDAALSQPHNIILLENNSKLTLLETQIDGSHNTYLANTVTQVVVGPQAELTYYKTRKAQPKSFHIAHTFVHQRRDSRADFTNLINDGHFTRDDLTVTLYEEGAECSTRGFYHLQSDDQYVDQHIDIKHAAARSRSEMLYKGIVDHKSRAVFNGRLHVEKSAQKIKAYQANHNVLLSPQAEAYSKPELEIYADDVVCKHGATTGQLDEEALFYLRTRGIPADTATKMLLQGFANEIMQYIKPPAIKHYMQAQLSFAHRGHDDENTCT